MEPGNLETVQLSHRAGHPQQLHRRAQGRPGELHRVLRPAADRLPGAVRLPDPNRAPGSCANATGTWWSRPSARLRARGLRLADPRPDPPAAARVERGQHGRPHRAVADPLVHRRGTPAAQHGAPPQPAHRDRRPTASSCRPACRWPPCRNWRRTEDAIVHDSGHHFTVIAASVAAANREVTRWTQPLLAPGRTGPVGVPGAPHRRCAAPARLDARSEAGVLDAAELGPTVQCQPGRALTLPLPRLPRYLDLAACSSRHAAVRHRAVRGGRPLPPHPPTATS